MVTRRGKSPENQPAAGCPVEQYARSVVAGEVVAGRLVRLACERHLRDLDDGSVRGLKFDHQSASDAIEFFGHLKLPDVDASFSLSPWEKFVIGSVFGWKGSDGYRRFRTAYCEVGKGNGKTPLAAGIGLFGLMADGELGAQIYSAATTHDQAGLSFRDAKSIAEASPALARRLEIGEHNIAHVPSGSFFRAVSSEHRGLDGKRVHIALVDELHEHPTAMVVDKMRANTKGRKQALIFVITNSGYDRTSVCWRHHEYSIRVLDGLEDDSWFAYVCTLDPCDHCREEGFAQPKDGCKECDNWRDEAVWLKANPNLGVSIQPKYLREQVREAIGMPSKENIVKRLNFCIWTEASTHAIPIDKWDLCGGVVNEGALRGQVCFAGLDIGATSDFTALSLLFPHDDAETLEIPEDPTNPGGDKKVIVRRSYTKLSRFWLPESPRRRDERMAAIIDGWRRMGLIKTTPGEVVDYDEVLEDIVEISKVYSLQEIAFDRGFQGAQMGTNLLKKFGENMVFSFPQGILSMNAPFRELQELIITRRLHHDNNPVTRWMISNTVAESRGGLTKPSKDHSVEKIDIVTAAVMALGRAMVAPSRRSVYEEEGQLAL